MYFCQTNVYMMYSSRFIQFDIYCLQYTNLFVWIKINLAVRFNKNVFRDFVIICVKV